MHLRSPISAQSGVIGAHVPNQGGLNGMYMLLIVSHHGEWKEFACNLKRDP